MCLPGPGPPPQRNWHGSCHNTGAGRAARREGRAHEPFVVLGLAGAWVAGRIEERPRVILAVLILFGATQAFALAFTTVLAETLEGTIRWWAAVLGNLFARVPSLDAQRVPPVVRPLGALLKPT